MENTEILDEFQKSNSGNENSLYIPQDTYYYLNMAAQWGNILAIIGFVTTGLGALFGLIAMASFGVMSSQMGALGGAFSGLMWVFLIFYFGLLACYIVPLLHLRRFAKNMKVALYSNDQSSLTVSFENLGRLFKFLGIMTLVVIGVYFALYFVMIAVASSAANSLQAF